MGIARANAHSAALKLSKTANLGRVKKTKHGDANIRARFVADSSQVVVGCMVSKSGKSTSQRLAPYRIAMNIVNKIVVRARAKPDCVSSGIDGSISSMKPDAVKPDVVKRIRSLTICHLSMMVTSPN
jgi:hypothetical protein